jgi:hypothetical protein
MSTDAVFLDIVKAVDATWHLGLLYKLSELKFSISLIKYYIWASFFIDVSLAHLFPSLMQLKTVHNLSFILKYHYNHISCYMFRPYLAIFRQSFTYWNCRTLLDCKSMYSMLLHIVLTKICLRIRNSLSVPRYFPFAVSMFVPPSCVCSH